MGNGHVVLNQNWPLKTEHICPNDTIGQNYSFVIDEPNLNIANITKLPYLAGGDNWAKKHGR